MNKSIKTYENLLKLFGILNLILIITSISSIFVFSFPEYGGLYLIWNGFGVAVPLLAICYLAEKKGRENLWRVMILVFVVISVLAAKGSVTRVAWAISLSVFVFPALFAPRPDGNMLMTRPKLWDIPVYLVLYGIGSITDNNILMAMGIIYMYAFIVLWVFSLNFKSCLKRIRDEKGEVEVDSILSQNRKYIVLFLLLFSILSLLIPFAISRMEKVRVVSRVSYEFGEETEEKEFPSPLFIRDKGISREAKAFDLSMVGKVLMWLFVSSCILFLLLEVGAIIWRFLEIEERKEKHKDISGKDFVIESVENKENVVIRKRRVSTSLEGRIRRLYKKTVEKRAKDKDISSLTTREIEKEILAFDSNTFTAIYEKTRYSGRESMERDYEEMKATLKRQKKSSK